MPVTVIARLQLKAGREADADAALAELIDATHAEAGCLAYALHNDPADARARVLIERWTSQVALDNHFQQPHMAAFAARGEELLDGAPDNSVLEPVVAGDPATGSL
jgi:quinol monooxygenase YgiN